MTYRLVDKPAFTAAGWLFRTTTAGGENMREIPKFWGRCLHEGKVKALSAITIACWIGAVITGRLMAYFYSA